MGGMPSKSRSLRIVPLRACNAFQSALDAWPFSLHVTHHRSCDSAAVFFCSSAVSSSTRRFVGESSLGSSLNKIVLTQVCGGALEAAWCTCRHIKRTRFSTVFTYSMCWEIPSVASRASPQSTPTHPEYGTMWQKPSCVQKPSQAATFLGHLVWEFHRCLDVQGGRE